MERFYQTLAQLPSERLLLSTSTDNFDELKNSRWLVRDTFLKMSQGPFAAANGIGQDHLHNLLNLQDAIVAELLLKRLEQTEDKLLQYKIFGLLQLIFTESPKLIEFIFTSSNVVVPLEILKGLIEHCPALFHCITIFKTFRDFESYSMNKIYYWHFITWLIEKYPHQSTLDLAKELVEEIEQEKHNNLFENNLESIKALLKTVNKTFPFQIKSKIKM